MRLRCHLIFLMAQHGSPHQSMSSKFLMDASLAPVKRRFERLNGALREQLPFSPAKATHSLSTVFVGNRYDRGDRQKVVVESEPNEENSCAETSHRLTERLYDGHESVYAYLVVCGVIGQNVGLCGLRNTRRSRFVSIADGFEELCENCFYECESLLRVTFGESSSLKLIGKKAFGRSGVREIHVPDSVEELCESCFNGCENLSRVTFGESSSLKKIGDLAFWRSGVREIHIPDSVEELCESCFYECESLSRVTFGESSSLKFIGKGAFGYSGVREIHIPDGIERLLMDDRTELPPECRVVKLA